MTRKPSTSRQFLAGLGGFFAWSPTRNTTLIGLVVFLVLFPRTPTLAVAQDAPEAQANDIHIKTSWLANGLRVVAITGPWPNELVSIRLLVQGGFLTVPSSERPAIHLLEHLVFRHTPEVEDILVATDRRGGWTYAKVVADHELHEFDVDQEWAQTILEAILFEWSRRGFDPAALRREKNRVLQERASCAGESPLSILGEEFRPNGALSFSSKQEVSYVDTVSAGSLRRMFYDRYTGARLTLLVAGNASVLSTLEGILDDFAAIPPGNNNHHGEEVPWLSGDLGTRSLSVSNGAGIHFQNPDEIPGSLRRRVLHATAARLHDEFGCMQSQPLPIDAEVCYTPSREIWFFYLRNSTLSIDSAEFAAYVLRALENLADPSSGPWWVKYVEMIGKDRADISSRPDFVSDIVIEDLVHTPQSKAAPQWDTYAKVPSATALRGACKTIHEAGVSFQTHLDRNRVDWTAMWENDESYSISAFILSETDSGELWWLISLFTVLLTLVIAIRVLAAIGADGFRRLRASMSAGSRTTSRIGMFSTILMLPFACNAAAATTPPQVHVLDNGLRMALCSTQDAGDALALRLFLPAPPAIAGSREHGVFEAVTRSLFRGDSVENDLFEYLLTMNAQAYVEVGSRYSTISFDISPSLLNSVVSRMAAQWTEGGLTELQFERGVEIASDLTANEDPWVVDDVLQMGADDGSDWGWWDLSLADGQRLFRDHLVAKRMVLVIAGEPKYLRQVRTLATLLEVIPAGHRVDCSQTDYSSRLHDRLVWPNDAQPWVMGWVAEKSVERQPSPPGFYLYALHTRVRELLAFDKGYVYDLAGESFVSCNEQVVVLKPYVDDTGVDMKELYDTFRDVAAELSEHSSLSWWEDFLSARQRSDHLFGSGTNLPSAIADDIVDRLDVSADSPATLVRMPYRPTADEARLRYTDLLGSGDFFFVEPAGVSLKDWASGWVNKATVVLWRDLFGPNERNRTIALMCHSVLILLFLRRFDRSSNRLRTKKEAATEHAG